MSKGTTADPDVEDKNYIEGFRSLVTNNIDRPVLNIFIFRIFGQMPGSRAAVAR